MIKSHYGNFWIQPKNHVMENHTMENHVIQGITVPIKRCHFFLRNYIKSQYISQLEKEYAFNLIAM